MAQRSRSATIESTSRSACTDAGTAYFEQTIDLAQLSEAEIARAGIGRKFQKPTVFEHHTVFENLELAMKADKRVRLALGARLTRADLDRIAETLGLIQLAGEADRLAGSLSPGQKQWLDIGMLLMREPRLLLLDEPVAGMTFGQHAALAAPLPCARCGR